MPGSCPRCSDWPPAAAALLPPLLTLFLNRTPKARHGCSRQFPSSSITINPARHVFPSPSTLHTRPATLDDQAAAAAAAYAVVSPAMQVALSNPKDLAGLMCAAAAAAAVLDDDDDGEDNNNAAALPSCRRRDSAAYEKHVEASSH